MKWDWRKHRTPIPKPIRRGFCAPVQKEWLYELPWKMQAVVNQGLRAPDTHFCKSVKIVCRWMRSIVFRNADPDHTFMCSNERLPRITEIENELNYCSVHFATHFAYALEIIAYKHPDEGIADTALRLYKGICAEILHFNPETKTQLEVRLADVKREPVVKKCPVGEADSYTYHV